MYRHNVSHSKCVWEVHAIADFNRTYTYRTVKKVVLDKSPGQFVVRAAPEQLEDLGID
jgi:hypothetical protein